MFTGTGNFVLRISGEKYIFLVRTFGWWMVEVGEEGLELYIFYGSCIETWKVEIRSELN